MKTTKLILVLYIFKYSTFFLQYPMSREICELKNEVTFLQFFCHAGFFELSLTLIYLSKLLLKRFKISMMLLMQNTDHYHFSDAEITSDAV